MYCTFQSLITFGEMNLTCCYKLDRQGYHIADHLRHWSVLEQRGENLHYKFWKFWLWISS